MPIPNNETRYFQLQIRTGSLEGPVQITSNVITVVDSQQAFIQATGGYVTIEDGYKTHHFDTSNTFQVVGLGIPANRTLEYFVVAGGGSGGRTVYLGGGGGAGGIVAGNVTLTTTGSYVAIVGGGAASSGLNGSNSNIVLAGTLNLHAIGGGRGAAGSDPLYNDARSGGSGGGGSAVGIYGTGAANVVGQGYPGGSWSTNPAQNAGGGGGGAGQAGFNGRDSRSPSPAFAEYQSAQGGNGISRSWISPLYGTPSYVGSGWNAPLSPITKDRWFGGGGGGGTVVGNPTSGGNHSIGWRGIGGGGGSVDRSPDQGASNRRNNVDGWAGSTNTGGGGAGYDGGGQSQGGGSGGSGFIAVRYPYTVETYNMQDIIGAAKATIDNSNVIYSLTTVNVSNATVLYWTLSGNVVNTDVLGGNTGAFTLINANATFSVRLANNIVSGFDSKVMTLELRKASVSGPIVATGNTITIQAASNRNNFINATGGNVTISEGYKIHVLTSSNTFAVSGAGTLGSVVEYLVIAGGGGGSGGNSSFGSPGGAGGAGGLLSGITTVSVRSYSANVGSGGTGGTGWNIVGTNGANTDIFGLVAVGGGGGTYNQPSGSHGAPGGSGAGAGGFVSSSGVTLRGGNAYIGQGYPGGTIFGSNPGGNSGAGGGGAGGGGESFTGFQNGPRGGGIGRAFSWVPGFYGTPGPTPGRWFAGGGGGATAENTGQQGAGGAGGGGRGAMSGPQALQAYSGNAFTGGGGGGGGSPSYAAGSGGSGIVIIRYPYV